MIRMNTDLVLCVLLGLVGFNSVVVITAFSSSNLRQFQNGGAVALEDKDQSIFCNNALENSVNKRKHHLSMQSKHKQRRRHILLVKSKFEDITCFNQYEGNKVQRQQRQQNDSIDIDSNFDRRKCFLPLFGTILSVSLFEYPLVSNAEYGADAKLFIPNPYETLNDRATKQCLVESLGNRECLVYATDASNFLYQGTDNQLLIDRIQKASIAFQQIPDLVTSKKWSQITGIMTGPMGELIRTMVQLASANNNENQKSKDLIKVVKNDLYALSDGVTKKDSAMVLQYHTKTTSDLVLFIKSL
jgi:hypothetical protein